MEEILGLLFFPIESLKENIRLNKGLRAFIEWGTEEQGKKKRHYYMNTFINFVIEICV